MIVKSANGQTVDEEELKWRNGGKSGQKIITQA